MSSDFSLPSCWYNWKKYRLKNPTQFAIRFSTEVHRIYSQIPQIMKSNENGFSVRKFRRPPSEHSWMFSSRNRYLKVNCQWEFMVECDLFQIHDYIPLIQSIIFHLGYSLVYEYVLEHTGNSPPPTCEYMTLWMTEIHSCRSLSLLAYIV